MATAEDDEDIASEAEVELDGEASVPQGRQDLWTEASRGLGAEIWKQVGGVKAIERERDSWASGEPAEEA